MTVYDIKPRFQALLRPLVKRLYAKGITANQVTLFAMFSSITIGLILVLLRLPQAFILLPFFLFFRMALNAIDGMLAREHQQKSNVGALLNEVGDVISDAALYFPFALLAGINPWLVILAILLANLTEFVGVLGQTIGADRRYDGPLGKSDRALWIGAYGLALFIWPHLVSWGNWLFALAILLLIWTCFNRSVHALRQAK